MGKGRQSDAHFAVAKLSEVKISAPLFDLFYPALRNSNQPKPLNFPFNSASILSSKFAMSDVAQSKKLYEGWSGEETKHRPSFFINGDVFTPALNNKSHSLVNAMQPIRLIQRCSSFLFGRKCPAKVFQKAIETGLRRPKTFFVWQEHNVRYQGFIINNFTFILEPNRHDTTKKISQASNCSRSSFRGHHVEVILFGIKMAFVI